MATAAVNHRSIEILVLDTSALLSTPASQLANLASRMVIPRVVLAELGEARSRADLEILTLRGVEVDITEPDAKDLVAVRNFAKQTGDLSSLSQADLSVLAVLYGTETARHGQWRLRDKVGGLTGQQAHDASRLAQARAQQAKPVDVPASSAKDAAAAEPAAPAAASTSAAPLAPRSIVEPHSNEKAEESKPSDPIAESSSPDRQAQAASLDLQGSREDAEGAWITPRPLREVQEEEASDEEEADLGGSDGEGEWITPINVKAHRAKALGFAADADLITRDEAEANDATEGDTVAEEGEDDAGFEEPRKRRNRRKKPEAGGSMGTATTASGKKSKKAAGKMTVAGMTGDYAMQNVMLQMGLALASYEGHRMKSVKSWALRCHACTKICKNTEEKFCPSCGNATLLRVSVRTNAPEKGGGEVIEINTSRQLRLRGSRYSLPMPKPSRAGGPRGANAPSSGGAPILRADQQEWIKALSKEKGRQEKEVRKLNRAAEKGKDGWSQRYQNPEDVSAFLQGGKADFEPSRLVGGLPPLGIGRKNPNERRRRKV
ncbi:Predicted RNA-binding protein Nob1p involved in 26S proteasome assembly [Ceraceosorus bombacis]|uniref:20S-pre-rRNA D-site endonuclease NOB1 n=1 Tax=Ceraceosorus bombacis TaxID=401625 RepID=A0A0P1B9P1_9BASI|nr:Predicted RNA-binding protein Nob1p involved in 26S proteasome assembly [Ceraceosorus bombacis]